MRERAPAMRPPARVGSKFLLRGLLKCGVCGGPFNVQGARSGKFAYYVCSKLMREGAGACESRYLNAPKIEGIVVDKIKERILTDETITELVTLVAEEVDQAAGELSGKLKAVEGELADVRKRLLRLYEALETSGLTMEVLSPRIYAVPQHEEQLRPGDRGSRRAGDADLHNSDAVGRSDEGGHACSLIRQLWLTTPCVVVPVSVARCGRGRIRLRASICGLHGLATLIWGAP